MASDKKIYEAIKSFVTEQGDEWVIAFYDGAYSGRYMFGKTCLAVQVPNDEVISHLFFHLGGLNECGEFELDHRIFDWKTDNFGDGLMLYWPRIAAPEQEDIQEPNEEGVSLAPQPEEEATPPE